MEKTLETIAGSSQTPQIKADNKKYEQRKFSTRSLTIDGSMSVRIPGRDSYNNIDKISVVYEQPMEIDLRGRVYENAGIIEVESARVSVTGYRENKAETALDSREKIIFLPAKDPEITLSRGRETIVLNQVIGIPVINIEHGSMTYSH